ncbi:MAG: hypothetical protein ACOCW4_00840 [bacterium]
MKSPAAYPVLLDFITVSLTCAGTEWIKIKFIILVSDEDERDGRFKTPCLVKVAIQSPFSFTEDRHPGDRSPGDRSPGDRSPGDRSPGENDH